MSVSMLRLLALPVVALAGLSVWPLQTFAVGGKQDTADWPCPQRKVAQLAASDLQWQGAAPETIKGWRDDGAIVDLVKILSSRRTPIEDAVKALKAYSEAVPVAVAARIDQPPKLQRRQSRHLSTWPTNPESLRHTRPAPDPAHITHSDYDGQQWTHADEGFPIWQYLRRCF